MLVSVKAGPERSDEELLLALASGDDSALAPIYRRHVPTVFKIAVQALGREAAEDVVQEVFASVWKNAGTFDPARGQSTRSARLGGVSAVRDSEGDSQSGASSAPGVEPRVFRGPNA